MKAIFTVHHQILSGLKYVQVVSRGPLKNKMQEMIVRVSFYPPSILRKVITYCKLTALLCFSPYRAHTPPTQPKSPPMKKNSNPTPHPQACWDEANTAPSANLSMTIK